MSAAGSYLVSLAGCQVWPRFPRDFKIPGAMAQSSRHPGTGLWTSIKRARSLRVLAARVRRCKSILIDRVLGIRTTPEAGRTFRDVGSGERRYEDSVGYQPLDYSLLARFLRPLRLGAEDVVFDIGCGSGRVLCVVARRAVRSVVGVEFDQDLAERAVANAKACRGIRAPVRVDVADAAMASYDGGTVYIMFNPFGAQTMRATLERIHESIEREPRRVRIAYFNPVEEVIFRECGWLRHTGRRHSIFFKTRASYWESAEPVSRSEVGRG